MIESLFSLLLHKANDNSNTGCLDFDCFLKAHHCHSLVMWHLNKVVNVCGLVCLTLQARSLSWRQSSTVIRKRRRRRQWKRSLRLWQWEKMSGKTSRLHDEILMPTSITSCFICYVIHPVFLLEQNGVYGVLILIFFYNILIVLKILSPVLCFLMLWTACRRIIWSWKSWFICIWWIMPRANQTWPLWQSTPL